MATPFLSEIKLVSFNFPPKGWAFCNGQLMPINQNQALFSLLGTTFGGDGRTNFALPNLQGRTIIHFGDGFTLGETGGVESVTLTLAQMAYHAHTVGGSTNAASSVNPNGMVLAVSPAIIGNAYGSARSSPAAFMSGNTIRAAGGSQPHENRMPGLVLNYVIALQGIFPSKN